MCLIDILPIKFSDKGFCLDYQYQYFIPLELTSLLYNLEFEEKKNKKYCINDNNTNKYLQFLKEKKEICKNFQLDKKMLEKKKELFLFDEDSRNKKTKEQKCTPKKQKKTRKEKGQYNKHNVIYEDEIVINFKYKNSDEFY